MVKKSKRTSLNDKNKLLALFLLLTVTCGLLITTSLARKNSQLVQELQDLKTGYYMKSWAVGDEIDATDFKLTVNGVDVDSVGIPNYLPVPEGMEYLAVDISLTNKTSNENIFIPLNTAYLRDKNGTKYDLSLAPNVESSVAGRIAAGDTIKGQIGFLVPQSAEGLRFYFEPFAQSSEIVVVDLKL